MVNEKKIRASEGTEKTAALVFKDIKKIIDTHLNFHPFSLVIREIAGISDSTFRNYLSGKQKGKISLFTCRQLSEFSGIPIGVFAGKEPFTVEYQLKFKEKLLKKFSADYTVMKNNVDVVSDFMELLAEKIAEKVLQKIEMREKNNAKNNH